MHTSAVKGWADHYVGSRVINAFLRHDKIKALDRPIVLASATARIFQPNTVEACSCGHIERLAIVGLCQEHGPLDGPPTTVGRNLRHINSSQQPSTAIEDPDSTRTGGVHVTLGIHLHPVRHALLGRINCMSKDLTFAERAVLLNIVDLDKPLATRCNTLFVAGWCFVSRRARIIYVKLALVRGQD